MLFGSGMKNSLISVNDRCINCKAIENLSIEIRNKGITLAEGLSINVQDLTKIRRSKVLLI